MYETHETDSRAVEKALEEFVSRAKARRILELRGSGLWECDLSELRRDRPARPARMIGVDTSAWIEVFRRAPRFRRDLAGGAASPAKGVSALPPQA